MTPICKEAAVWDLPLSVNFIKRGFSGRGLGQRLFSFQSPAVQ